MLRSRTLLALTALILIGFIAASYFTFPAYDDYDYASLVSSKGFWNFQVYHYFAWGGRYASNFIISAMINTNPTWDYYGAWSAAIILITVGAFAFLGGAVKRFRGEGEAWYALLALVTLLGAAPTIVQFFYWVTGAVYYTVGIVASAIGMGLLFERERRRRVWVDVALWLVTFVIVGNNEIAMIGWMELLLTYLVLKWCKTKKWDAGVSGLIVFGTAFGLFSLFAPGNFVRQKHFEKSGQVFRTVGNGLLHFFIFSVTMLSPSVVVLILKFRRELIGFAERVLVGIEERRARNIVFAHWFLFIFTTTALAFWAMGRKQNTRSLNVVMFYYWAMLPFVMWWFARSWKWKIPKLGKQLLDLIDRHGIALFVLFLLLSKNVRNLGIDYLHDFTAYRSEAVQRIQSLNTGRDQTVILHLLKTKPQTTFYNDFQQRDQEHLERVFGIKKLILVE